MPSADCRDLGKDTIDFCQTARKSKLYTTKMKHSGKPVHLKGLYGLIKSLGMNLKLYHGIE